MRLTKRGEVVLFIGTIALAALSIYWVWLAVRLAVMVWSLRGYDLR